MIRLSLRIASLGCCVLVPTTLLLAQPPQERPPAPVWVAPITRDTFDGNINAVGTIVPSKIAILGSAADGRVSEFPVESGDRIQDRQPVAQLLTETIELEHAVAVAELNLRTEELKQLTNGALPEELQQSQAALDAAEARKIYYTARRQRLEALAKRTTAVAEEEFEEAISQSVEADQLFLQRKAEYELVKQGPRAELIAQAEARVAMQEATAKRLADQIAKHTVISRFDGYVTAEFTEVGQWVKRGDPVVEVSALDEVDVEVYVVEEQIPFIVVGSEVTVSVPALGERTFPGSVRAVVPKADVKTRTFPVRIRVTNEILPEGPVLKSGMLATISLPIRSLQDSLLVSKDAVVLGGAKPMVFVVNLKEGSDVDGQVSPIPVELGVALGTWIEIKGAIQAGQWVVVRGNERLRPGQAVRIIEKLAGPPPVTSPQAGTPPAHDAGSVHTESTTSSTNR